MLRRLKEHRAESQLVCTAFDVASTRAVREVAESAITKEYKVHLLAFDEDGRVRSKDISGLDPESEDEAESGWGGLTGFSSRFGDAVRNSINEAERF